MKYYNEIVNRTLLSLPLWKLRVYIKRLLCFLNVRKVSYCYRCGIDVRDFDVPDKEWNNVYGKSDESGILCYNCFCDINYMHNKCNCKKFDLISYKKKR